MRYRSCPPSGRARPDSSVQSGRSSLAAGGLLGGASGVVHLLEVVVFPLDHGLRTQPVEQLRALNVETAFKDALRDLLAGFFEGLRCCRAANLELEQLITGFRSQWL